MSIILPEDDNREFSIEVLINHLNQSGLTHIIQGQQHVALNAHTKNLSLDFWLRTNIAQSQDTAQATNNVIEQLVASGSFIQSNNLVCPNSGRLCSGIELSET